MWINVLSEKKNGGETSPVLTPVINVGRRMGCEANLLMANKKTFDEWLMSTPD